ncbi:MAG: DUF3500 domain-containing protein [Pseudomonadales bacterium]|nr:DUF3500 domain-containing protein [Pseudomonadales bacterium]
MQKVLASLLVLVGFTFLSVPIAANPERLSATANQFIRSLNNAQKVQAVHDLKSDSRATWSNFPIVMAPPVGILLSQLNDQQRALVQQMMQTSLSSQGHLKANAIIWLDDFLRIQEKAALDPGADQYEIRSVMAETRSSGNYAVAIFGEPNSATWGWKITGHHIGVNITVANNKVGFFPLHLGSNPLIITTGPYAGFTPLAKESELGLDFFASLSPQQRSAAGANKEQPREMFEGPGRRGGLTAFEGLNAKLLDADQRASLQILVAEHVRNGSSTSAASHLDLIADAGWENLWFSWRGQACGHCEFYYRVQGPRLLIEYFRQSPNHVHLVVRDPKNDYGEDWLGHHYSESHPSFEDAMVNLRKAAGVSE